MDADNPAERGKFNLSLCSSVTKKCSATQSITPELLASFRCPETQQRLAPAPGDILEKIEAMRAVGKLCDQAGKPVTEPVRAGLLRADGKVFFPIRSGIPVLLIEESIEVSGAPA